MTTPLPTSQSGKLPFFARFGAKNISDLFGGKAEPDLTFLDLGPSLVHPALTFSSQTKRLPKRFLADILPGAIHALYFL